MKITIRKLKKIIKEAAYFPATVGQEDIKYLNTVRPMLTPEQRAKADSLVAHEPKNLSGYMLGGGPEDKPDQPMETFDMDSRLDLSRSKYASAGGMKEIVMAIDDDIYSYLVNNGRVSMRPDQHADPDLEKIYTAPISDVYREFRRHHVDKNLIDEIIDHYSYYGYERSYVNMGGNQVEFLKVIDQ